jgi:uncharacterized protein YndB with AHSA1/START domain
MTQKPKFVYVTYIRSTPEKIWHALTDAETEKKFWLGVHLATDWKKGSPWQMLRGDGGMACSGEVLEATPPKKLVLRWIHEGAPEIKAEGYSRCSIELEPTEGAVKLTVVHEMESPTAGTKLIEAVGGGWPAVLSNLKSFLETGAIALEEMPCSKKHD